MYFSFDQATSEHFLLFQDKWCKEVGCELCRKDNKRASLLLVCEWKNSTAKPHPRFCVHCQYEVIRGYWRFLLLATFGINKLTYLTLAVMPFWIIFEENGWMAPFSLSIHPASHLKREWRFASRLPVPPSQGRNCHFFSLTDRFVFPPLMVLGNFENPSCSTMAT